MPTATLYNPGDCVNGRYKILNTLGAGAMGEVYSALDSSTSNQIAIKFLKDKENLEHSLNEFKTEFSLLTHLSHPHIAKVYDFEQDSSNLRFFFTSEFVDGFDFITATRGLQFDAVEGLFVQALRALEYLHANGVFHFDIKGANLLVVEKALHTEERVAKGGELNVKVIDFGLASLRFRGRVVGTPSYMAPEMILRENPDGRADIYSLGVLMYAVLTGSNPFRSVDQKVTMDNHLKLTPPPASSKAGSVPKYFDDILMKMMEKRASDRYQTAGQVIKDLNLRSSKRYQVETEETVASYIPFESKFVGRRQLIAQFEKIFSGNDSMVAVIKGASGSGKTRLMNEAKFLGQLSEWKAHFLSDALKADEWKKNIFETGSKMLVGIDDYDKVTSELWGRTVHETCNMLIQRIKAGIGGGAPVVLLMAVDEESVIARSPDFCRGDEAIPIILSNFTSEDIREYLTAVTGLSDPPRQLVEDVRANTGGNPFLVTELLKALVAEGVIVDSHGRWKESTFEDIKVKFERLKVPQNVEERILKDVEGLKGVSMSILEMFSVMNKPLNMNTAGEILGNKTIKGELTALCRRGILTFNIDDMTYFFAKPILAKAIYRRMPEVERAKWHDVIASPVGAKQSREELLFHSSRGTDESAAKKALLELIAIQMNEFHNYDAIENVKYFLEKWDEPRIRLDLAKLYNRIGKYDEAIKTAETCNVKPETLNMEFEVSALEIIGIAYLRQTNFNAARQNFFAALATADNLPAARRLRIENFIAEVAYFEGNIDKAIEIYERTAEVALLLPREERISIANNNLGQAYFQKGEYQKAIEQLEKDIALHQRTGNKRLIARLRYILAESYHMAGRFELAVNNYNLLLDYSKSADDFEHLFRAYNGMGGLYLQNSKFAEAAGFYERALDVSSRLGFEEYAISCITNLGITNSNMGDLKKAEEYLSSALAYFEGKRASHGLMEQYHCRVHLELGEICRQYSRFEEAKRHLEEALTLSKEKASQDLAFWVRLIQLKLAVDEGDNLAANCLLDEARQLADTEEKKARLEESLQ